VSKGRLRSIGAIRSGRRGERGVGRQMRRTVPRGCAFL